MKKRLSILLTFVMVLSLCACGNSAEGGAAVNNETPTNGETQVNSETSGNQDEYDAVLEALLSDGGQWGLYEQADADAHSSEGFHYYTFREDGTFKSLYYVLGAGDRAKLDTSEELEYGIDTDEDIVYYISPYSGNRSGIPYTYEDGEFSLLDTAVTFDEDGAPHIYTVPMIHTDWDTIQEEVLRIGFHAIYEYFGEE